MRTQVAPNHYYDQYDTLARFCSYWHQIDAIVSRNPKSILELGIGNGFVSRYLQHRGFNVVTLDLDKRLNPDVAASVLKIPFSDEAFELVACYEVLEHLPFECFKQILSELFRVSSSHVLLSLPDVNRDYRVFLHVPKMGLFKKVIQIPRLRPLINKFNGEHYWEIGRRGYSLRTIVDSITEVGFQLEKTYRIFEWPYHRFFVIKRTGR